MPAIELARPTGDKANGAVVCPFPVKSSVVFINDFRGAKIVPLPVIVSETTTSVPLPGTDVTCFRKVALR